MSAVAESVLFDGGNTYLKWAVVNAQAELVSHGRCLWRGLDAQVLRETLQRDLPWSAIVQASQTVLGSVADAARNQVLIEALEQAGPSCSSVSVDASWPGLSLAYEDPRSLGVDRWLAMLGAQYLSESVFVVADCGTALTLDAVDAQGQHLGGLIAPGFELMQQSLLTRTARIRDAAQPLPSSMFGASTADAVNAGCSFPAGVMLDRFVHECAQTCGLAPAKSLEVFVTGGGSERLLHGATVEVRVVADLVLLGLLRWQLEAQRSC